MVVQTRDPLAPSDGLFSDAEENIPEDDGLLAVPDGSDESDPSVDDSSAEAATEDEAVDDDQAALRESLRAELEQTLKAEMEPVFNDRLRTLQRTLEQQKAALSKENQRLKAQADFRERWFNDYLTKAQNGEVQPDARDFAVYESQLTKATANVEQSEQQKVAAFQQWSRPSMQNMTNYVTQKSRSDAGEQLFDPSDPDILKLGAAIYYWAEQAHMTGDPTAYENNARAMDAHKELVAKKREEGLLRLTAAGRQKTAKQVQDVRAKQRERGVQATVRGGGAGAATAFDTFYQQAQRELPDGSKDDIYLRAMELNQAARAPQSRR